MNISEYDCWKYNCRCEGEKHLHTERHWHSAIDVLVDSMTNELIHYYIEEIEKKHKRRSEDYDSILYRFINFFPSGSEMYEDLGRESNSYSEHIFEYYITKLYEKIYTEL